MKFFFFFRNKDLHSIETHLSINSGDLRPQHKTTALKMSTCQDLTGLLHPKTTNSSKKKEQNTPDLKKNLPRSCFETQKFQNLIHQTLLKRKKDTFDKEQSVPHFDQITFFRKLYHFFDVEVKKF